MRKPVVMGVGAAFATLALLTPAFAFAETPDPGAASPVVISAPLDSPSESATAAVNPSVDPSTGEVYESEDAVDMTETANPDDSRTWLALLSALGVALLAGLAVFVIRK
ncbi:MAG: hypothetical protein LBQ92_03450 [Propionibacteriaceae bacterium]|jgi:hypothetical protein|nr:hypothetical protein [Propionibacteriaceae bacterium]